MGTNIKDKHGKRLTRDTDDWINKQGSDPINEVKIYSAGEKKVLVCLRNEKTKARLLMAFRAPTDLEEIEYNTKLFQKGESPVTGKSYNQLEVISRKIQ